MEQLSNFNLVTATDWLGSKLSRICGRIYSGSWLWDKLLRFFEAEPAAVSVTMDGTTRTGYPVTVTVWRSGRCDISPR